MFSIQQRKEETHVIKADTYLLGCLQTVDSSNQQLKEINIKTHPHCYTVLPHYI